MKLRQSALIDTANHIEAFLDQNAAVVGSNVTSARANLQDAVTQLTTMASTQTGGTIAGKGATAREKAVRTMLRNNYMAPVAHVAKLLLSDVPEIGALAVKSTTMSSTQLVAAAHGMADAAEPYAAIFTKNGLPDDFVTQLRSAADAVSASIAGRQQTNASTTSAVVGMQAQEQRVRSMIKVLNGLVVPKLGSNPLLLTQWRLARSISASTPIVPVPASVAASVTSAASTPVATPSAPAAPAPVATTQPSTAPTASATPASPGA